MATVSDKKYHLSASLICADFRRLEDDIKELEKGGIDSIHYDVMDGVFVPRFGLYPEILGTVRGLTKLPVDVHCMVVNAEPYIKTFADAGATTITVHAEGNNNLHRTLKLLYDAGVKAGIALNPATPLGVLDYVLGDIDQVMLMAINPGIVGHKLIPQMMEKITDLKKKLVAHPDIQIVIDGGVTFESAPAMIRAGADVLVCGSSTIFRPGEKVSDKIKELRAAIEVC